MGIMCYLYMIMGERGVLKGIGGIIACYFFHFYWDKTLHTMNSGPCFNQEKPVI